MKDSFQNDVCAEAAARAAGVRVRELTALSEFEEVHRLFDAIWHPEPGNPPISLDTMRALSHAGDYVAGAYQGDRMVGASVAFFGAPPGQVLHSHLTGASAGRGIGFALKLHQRAWALAWGLDRITWTYDPLVRRNAHFNLVKLGARPEEYLPCFYGAMDDAINAGDESDRVLAVWRLSEPQVVAAARGVRCLPGVPPDAVAGLTGRDGLPVAGPADARVVLVAVPPDIETLRRTDPAAARAWRRAVRDVLGGLMEEGARVAGFTGEGDYIVERAA
ncbi:GNAT family N-acetyltransferase [Streptosporangium sp. NPDC087985]|uniref:GNAT family N-acetyltransferase n=1 Tax=Streptosporangium sp. NPDC087985 TaxID=3366196 RepID=UPI0037FE62E7